MLQYLVICFPFSLHNTISSLEGIIDGIKQYILKKKKSLFVCILAVLDLCYLGIFLLQLRGRSSLQCAGSSLWWPLLLWSTCCREPRLQYLWCMDVVAPHIESSWTRGLNLCPLYWQADSHLLGHQRSPKWYILNMVNKLKVNLPFPWDSDTWHGWSL